MGDFNLFGAIFALVGLFCGGFLGSASNPIGFSAECDRATIAGISAQVGLALGSIAALFAYLLYRSAPNHRDLRFMTPAVLLLGFFFGSLGLGLYLNEALDASPSTRYEGLIVKDKREHTRDEGDSSYHVEVIAPPEDTCSSTWQVTLPRDLYDAIQAGHTRVAVDVKPGAFGFPWAKKVSILKFAPK